MSITKKLLILLLVISASLRLYRLDFPKAYVFDEIYHAYTAKEYLRGNKEAWSPWGKATEEKVAFEWLHPPIAKELMSASMWLLHSTQPWAWRLPGVIMGTVSIFLVYLLAQALFSSPVISLTSALAFSLDGLVFTQSRVGMNDVYLVAFILASALFFTKKKFLLSALFCGLATATKWSGIFLLPVFWLMLVIDKKQPLKQKLLHFFYFLIFTFLIYLLSYLPYFLQGYTYKDFIELNKQIWWYQTHLKATHPYTSPAWMWPLNLVPVWYYVQYFSKNYVANIFASGNIVVFLGGVIAILFTVWEFIKKHSSKLLLILFSYFIFWVPWVFSPRIMFLYHYSPSVPFLSIALGYQLNNLYKNKKDQLWFWVILLLMVCSFLLLYPFLTGIPLPEQLVGLFFFTNLAKNPF